MDHHRLGRRMELRVPFAAGKTDVAFAGELLSPRTHNLSSGGICFGQLNVPICSAVKVFIELPTPSGGQTVMLDGEVAWRKLSGTGVCFTQPPPPALAEYLQQLP